MKFGIFDFGLWHESQTSEDIYRAAVDHAQLADVFGFECIWLGEHHFSRHGIYGNVLTLGAFIAARTDRLRIGTAVIVLPLHHPLRVAEEVATVDVLSNGRVDLGVGSGYQRMEFERLGVNIDESRARFAESLDIIQAAWSQDNLQYEGKFYQWSGSDDYELAMDVQPKPYKQRRPNIYIAVSTSPETIEMAARRNMRILLGGPTDIMGVAPQVIERWQEAMRAAGNDPTGIDIPVAKGIYVAETDEKAAADIAATDRFWDLKLLNYIGSPISPGGKIPPGYEHWGNRAEDRRNTQQKNTAGTDALIGSPETVAKRIKDLQDMGINYIFGGFGLPGMPEADKRRSIELFGREVLPRFAESPVTAAG
jgi:alkanesulfonate monooxygenase SsuD/methylene tetrahydromethanopterin reductase-like flavin-dependent oxidoreductase (luciferase family)